MLYHAIAPPAHEVLGFTADAERLTLGQAKQLVDVFIASHAEPPAELVLDFDATDDEVHGKQVGCFFHGCYDSYCFLPIYVFCGDYLLAAYLRPSNIDAARHSRAILKLLVRRLRLPEQEHAGRALYEQTYWARGECENRIKRSGNERLPRDEQQLDLFAGRTSCHEFLRCSEDPESCPA